MSDEPQVKAFSGLLQYYKNQPAHRDFVSPLYPGHVIYWLLIKMCHSGHAQLLSTVATQLGVLEQSLRVGIEALRDVPNSPLPLSIGMDPASRQDTVRIDQDAVESLRLAAAIVSPEHMPEQVLQQQRGERISPVGAEYFFHRFEDGAAPDPSEHVGGAQDVLSLVYRYPVDDVLGLLAGTKGLEDAKPLGTGHTKQVLSVIAATTQVIVMPAVCITGTGGYAERLAVLDLRDKVQDYYTSAFPAQRTLGLMISLGFTREARLACLRTPKVLLVDLWAFLRLIGVLQRKARVDAGAFAIEQMRRLLTEGSGDGRFHTDGYVGLVVRALEERYAGA